MTPFAIPTAASADPDDDQVIAAAVAAHAELIVSGDRHLLDLGSHQDIRIVTPAEAPAWSGFREIPAVLERLKRFWRRRQCHMRRHLTA